MFSTGTDNGSGVQITNEKNEFTNLGVKLSEQNLTAEKKEEAQRIAEKFA